MWRGKHPPYPNFSNVYLPLPITFKGPHKYMRNSSFTTRIINSGTVWKILLNGFRKARNSIGKDWGIRRSKVSKRFKVSSCSSNRQWKSVIDDKISTAPRVRYPYKNSTLRRLFTYNFSLDSCKCCVGLSQHDTILRQAIGKFYSPGNFQFQLANIQFIGTIISA